MIHPCETDICEPAILSQYRIIQSALDIFQSIHNHSIIITLFSKMDFEHILTSSNHVEEIIFQIIIILTDHDKTITTLLLFHQLISVSFLTSNRLLNCKIVRKLYICLHFQVRHVAMDFLCFTYMFLSFSS